jgi:outer membrane murein-binding lipoprotein Lpp
MEKYNELTSKVMSLADDVAKVSNGNKAARTRVRVGLQEVKKLAQELRVEINNID